MGFQNCIKLAVNNKLVFPIFQFRSTACDNKIYMNEVVRGTMIAAITTIIAAYDNNDSSGTRYTRRAVVESSRERMVRESEGTTTRKVGERAD